ncbi:MAG: hypothetical protein WAV73_04095 [Candidatus Moraniibacteriota bacterium]
MKKIKRISQDTEVKKVFSESQVMMLLEKMDDHIQLVAEGLMGLERRMDDRFEQVDAGFKQIDDRFEQMDVRFKQLEANQAITLKHLFNIDDKFEAMEKELKEIKLELARLSEKILSSKEIKSFSKRISVIEKDMEKLRIFVHSRSKLKVA